MSKKNSNNSYITVDGVTFTYSQYFRCLALASIPKEEFEKILSDAEKAGDMSGVMQKILERN